MKIKALSVIIMLLAASCAVGADDEMLPGTPGTIVIPDDDGGGHTGDGGSSQGGGIAEGILFGGRFGGFLPFSQNNYLGFDSLAWRFEALVNLEGGDWKAAGNLGFYTSVVEDPPDFNGQPSFWALPVGLGVYYEFGGGFSPYAGGGVGFTVFHVSDRDHIEDGFQSGFTELLFTPHLAVGLDLFRDEAFRVNVEARLELSWSEEQSQVGGFSFMAGLAF